MINNRARLLFVLVVVVVIANVSGVVVGETDNKETIDNKKNGYFPNT